MKIQKQISIAVALVLLLAFSFLAASAQSAGKRRGARRARPRPQVVAVGDWGGQQARLTVKETETTIEFPCAEGSIAGRLKVDKSGNFRSAGTYTGRSHGPIRVGSEPKPEAVTYSGTVKGNKMTLVLEFPNSTQAKLSAELEKGNNDDRFVRCY